MKWDRSAVCLLSAVLALSLIGGACSGGGKKASTTTGSAATTNSNAPTTNSGAPTTTCGAPTTNSDVALNVPTSGCGGSNYTQGSYLEGFEFTANKSISITKLGAYDSNLASLAGKSGSETFATVPVAVYDISSNTRLAGVNVRASDPPTGIYRYAALSSPIALNTTDTYAVVNVSLTNNYLNAPALVASNVNAAISYLAFAGYGPGGQTMTNTMVEPNFFYTESANGLRALNYDLGPNFMFTS